MANPAWKADASGEGDTSLLSLVHPNPAGVMKSWDTERYNPDPFGQGLPGLDAPPSFPTAENTEVDDVALEKAVERQARIDSVIAKYDTSSLASKPGDDDNWIERAGGDLPSFVRAIAHALIRQGRPKSQAIAIAIGTIKRWAAGGGDVTAATRAKAAKAVAEWEALKAKA
ncbi:MAG: hypothetical protein MUF33_00425 [Candidatus Nanopelagicales bacterium]|jgi:hypothetical protein|nr:hypothetical protein [Candidatus Nanopelagicales bacterium]